MNTVTADAEMETDADATPRPCPPGGGEPSPVADPGPFSEPSAAAGGPGPGAGATVATRIRNVAIIAHVDHGKTTLVDELLKGAGVYRENQAVAERVMDSMDLEREKGITIKAKNTAVRYGEHIINIVDTPGHADFGGEVERVMKMVDGVLLVVDAYEGPQAQTRFVLRKALQHGLEPVVVINKIDRENSDPLKVHDAVLELFLELDANDEQLDAPFLYGSAKEGYMLRELGDEPSAEGGMTPLFEAILSAVPAPEAYPDEPFRMLVSNIDWDDYVGRVAVGKVHAGRVAIGDRIVVLAKDGSRRPCKVTKVIAYSGLGTRAAGEGDGGAGDIVGVSGFDEIDIGDTLATSAEAEPLPFVEIDPPTIAMQFSVNDGPLAGREGKLVNSRQVRERLFRETKTNISIQVSDSDRAGTFDVVARGAMQVAVLVETMRREGYEVCVSRPTAITRREGEDGPLLEPFETAWVEAPAETLGGILKNLAGRKGKVEHMENHTGGVTLEVTIPTRGLIGFEFDLLNLTSGRGVVSHLFKEYAPHCGAIATRTSGTLVSMDTGLTRPYALAALEDRGKLFIGPGEDVYAGMIVGENPRSDDMPVNPTKEKQLTNFRCQGEGKGIQLSPPVRFSLERAIEYLAPDELLEATPKSLRLRKRILDATARNRERKRAEG